MWSTRRMESFLNSEYGVFDMIWRHADLREVNGGLGMEVNSRGRWSLRRTCVWEPSMIHTLLITMQLSSIRSLRRFTVRGALMGALWVFVSEFKKKTTSCDPTDQCFCGSFWLTKSSPPHSLTLFFIWNKSRTSWVRKHESNRRGRVTKQIGVLSSSKAADWSSGEQPYPRIAI